MTCHQTKLDIKFPVIKNFKHPFITEVKFFVTKIVDDKRRGFPLGFPSESPHYPMYLRLSHIF